MRSAVTVSLVSVATLLLPAAARADPCAGASPFQDVLQAAGFCSDALWARNALITVGCGAGPIFCPGQSVTRAQMVLFLRRTAEATFPSSRFAESSTLPAGDLDTTGLATCTTTSITVAADANARHAHVHGVVSMQAGGSPVDVQMSVGHSVNGGAFTADHAATQIVTIPAGQWTTGAVMAGFVPIAPGTANLWRIDLSRAPGSATTGELANLRCQLKVISHMDAFPPL